MAETGYLEKDLLFPLFPPFPSIFLSFPYLIHLSFPYMICVFLVFSKVFVCCVFRYFGYFRVRYPTCFECKILPVWVPYSRLLSLFFVSPFVVRISFSYCRCFSVFSSKAFDIQEYDISTLSFSSPYLSFSSYFIFGLGAVRRCFWVLNSLVWRPKLKM